jgi:hypothetical protein
VIIQRTAGDLPEWSLVTASGSTWILRRRPLGLAHPSDPSVTVRPLAPETVLDVLVPDRPQPLVPVAPADEVEAVMVFAKAGFTVELIL